MPIAMKLKLKDHKKRKGSFFFSTIMCLLAFMLLGPRVCEAQLISGRVNSYPNTVGAQSATLGLLLTMPVMVPGGSKIRVTVPEQTSLQQSDQVPCQIKGIIDLHQLCATNGPQEINFILPDDMSLFMGSVQAMRFKGVFFAPLSTNAPNHFKVQITDKAGAVLANDNGSMYLSDLVPNALQSATISQVNQVTVGAQTAVYFTVTSLNPIPIEGGVQIKFPKWNPQADALSRESYVIDEQSFIAGGSSDNELPQSDNQDGSTKTDLAIDYSKLCSAKSGVLKNLGCDYYYTSTYEYITLTKLFSKTREAGDTFQFYISRLRNPVSQSAVPFEVVTFESIQEILPGREPIVNGLIDRANAMFQPEQAAKITDAMVWADTTTVQEFSKFHISFKIPVPVAGGCIVTIQLPDEFKLDAGVLTRIKGSGIFGRMRDLSYGIDESSRIIKFHDQCASYSGENTPGVLEIEMLENPYMVKQTKTFFIQVTDSNSKGVAEIFQGLLYKPTAGIIKEVKLYSLGGTTVEDVVDLRLDFTPPHKVSGLATAIILKMPIQLEFSCTFAFTFGLKTAPDCKKIKYNEFRLQNPFNQDNFDGNLPLTLTFRSRILPGAATMIEGISIQIMKTYEDRDYVIDELVDDDQQFFAPISQLFMNSEIETGIYEVYSDTTFTFKMQLSNNVPSDAIIFVTIPPQVEVGDVQKVQDSCGSSLNLREKFDCIISPIVDKNGEKTGGHMLEATGAIPDSGLSRMQKFEFQIKSGLYTPLSMKTSETFKFVITNNAKADINFDFGALSVTMKHGKDVGPFELSSGSSINGELTDHTLRFTAPAPIYQGFLIMVIIPEEVGAPMDSNFKCKIASPLSQANSECRINGQRVTITVAIDDAYPEERIPIGTPLEIQISPVQNPGSTMPSSQYAIEIRTGYYQIVAEQTSTGPSVIDTTPATIISPEFKALDLRQLAMTTVTITWLNTQLYPKDLAIKIYTDPSEIVPVFEDPATDNSVPCVFRQTVIVSCEYLKDEPGVIRVTNLLIASQNPGSLLELTVTRQKINVLDPGTTKSWKMTTFTDSSTAYSIDRVESGLAFTFECNLPCLTCLPNDPNYCLSCNQYNPSEYLISFAGLCQPDCPSYSYREAYMCRLCDDKCKTCAQHSGSTCTSCNGDSEKFPFLYGNTCVDTCVFGFYGNRADASCQTCVDPCATCVDAPDKCLSCKLPAAGDPIDKFYFEHQCLIECPQGYVANEAMRSNVCERCSDNCETCDGNKDQCFTCKPGMKLNLRDRTCVYECPDRITIQQSDAQLGGDVCVPCDSSCVTCSDEPNFCTKCQNNLSLLPAEGICKLDCDENNFTQVSIKGECVGCSASCKTCQYTQDTCLSCYDGMYFYGAACVAECPEKDGYQYTPNSEGHCIIPGIRCPFGYDLTPNGNGCILKAQICLEPNELNYDMTSCVPGSDAFIPFPLLACCAAVTLIVLISKMKNRESRFIANMIVFWSIIEFVAVLVVFYLSLKFGIKPVVYMILVAIMFQVATNLFFFVVFQKQIMNDLTFFHWAQYNRCTVKVICAFGLAFNFKVYRLLYSKFCGSKKFDAPFDNPHKFYTPLNVASWINLLIVMLLCLVACFFGVYYVSWGYQLCVECLELIIIEIVMLILSVVEYCQMRSEGRMDRTPNWQVDAKQVDRLKVKSGYDDELSMDEQDPDAYLVESGTRRVRKEVKPKALKTIHTMEKVLAQLLVKKDARKGGYVNTVQEIEQLHERELMLRYRRRCMSFRQERPDFREAWGFGSDEEDECDQNFISEPGSPRSKEMLQNKNFSRRMQALSSAYHMRDKFDNVYAEARDLDVWPQKNVPMANKKLQTNVMELLGVDDLHEDTQTEISEIDQEEIQCDEYLYDHAQTAALINNVIDRIDDTIDDDHQFNSIEPLHPKIDKIGQIVPVTSSQPPPKPRKPKRKRKQLTKRRQAEMPNFTVEEILGEFEPDEQGNAIILQTANGKLNDKYGRMVNHRGYLIDPAGNVITRGNVFIFYQEEIDFDDEIPAPYCFRKQKQTVKFNVLNFNQHRRMRRKDKLAFQDEYVEREYLKLKQEARTQGVSVDAVKSQQFSQRGDNTVRPYDPAKPPISSIRGHRVSSNVSRHGLNNSHVPLLQQSEDSRTVDVNMMLCDRDSQDDMTVDDFMAKNSTNVKRKPSKKPSSNSRLAEQEQFIDQVTEPMKAKTKIELLGPGLVSSDNLLSSRSNRSGSLGKSHVSSSKPKLQYQIKDGKMLNVSSHNSMDKRVHQETSEQHASQAELMELATAGEAEDFEEDQPRNLDFDTNRKLNKSARSSIKAKQSSAVNYSRPTSTINDPLYAKEQQNINVRKQAVVNDQAFINQVQKFNDSMSKRKMGSFRNERHGSGSQPPRIPPPPTRAATAGIIDDTFLNPDGSVRNIGLAHKNLNHVYGRVRSKFNQQIRSGSDGYKQFRPKGKSYRNRIDEPSRIIAGMSYNQRERMLQLEINNLMECTNGEDELSMASVRRKLQFKQQDSMIQEKQSQAHSSPSAVGSKTIQMSTGKKRQSQGLTNGKMQALRNIYSEYRLNQSGSKHSAGNALSPLSNMNFEASRILDASENRQLVAGNHLEGEFHNATTPSTAYKRNKMPGSILEGKYR